MKIEIKSKYNSTIVIYACEAETLKDAVEKAVKDNANLMDANLRNANLMDANLWNANLSNADLWNANLSNADLSGAKNYYDHHKFLKEIVRQQKVELFTESEWCFFAQLDFHMFCWDTVIKRFKDTALSAFKKVADAGYPEYYEKLQEKIGE